MVSAIISDNAAVHSVSLGLVDKTTKYNELRGAHATPCTFNVKDLIA